MGERKGKITISGANGMVEVEGAAELGGPWDRVTSINVTNVAQAEIEFEMSLSGTRFFRIRGQ
jgi:hypothetical protein